MFSGYRTMLIFSSFVWHCSIFLRFSLGKGVYPENFYCFVLSLHNIERSFKPRVCFDLVPDRKQLSLLYFVYIWSKQTRNYSFCFFHYKFVSLGRQCMGHAEMTLTIQATLKWPHHSSYAEMTSPFKLRWNDLTIQATLKWPSPFKLRCRLRVDKPPISERIKYKVACLCFSARNGSGSACLSELLHVYTPSRTLRSSSDTRMLKIQQYKRKTHG